MSDFLLRDRFDVVVIGAGAAGLYTALCLPEHLHIGLITKDTIALSASDWAQGGIAAVTDPDDSPELHIADTLKAGAGLCDEAAVRFLVEQAPACIQRLIEMGVAFDRHNGKLALTLEAAHSRRRVLHAADTTGRAVVTTLTAQVLSRKQIQVLPQTLTLDLWLDDDRHCQGVQILHQGHLHWIRAGAVVLATGGGGQVFAQTTNPAVSTGDGVAIAHRAGATLRDLEFVQFHPTALTKPGAPRFLISEAVRGEGAHLVNDRGDRFTFDYHPAGELAPRDVVSRAIFSYLQSTEADPTTAHVWLDLRSIPVDRIHHRFPNIIQNCQRWGINLFEEPIPVAPAAHYWMGGIVANQRNQTSIPRLYAVGETASTGVHGANRLASNSLLECLVFGAQLAHLEVPPIAPAQLVKVGTTPPDFPAATLTALRQALPRLVWQSAGICRDGAALTSAIAQVDRWQSEFAALEFTQWMQSLPIGATIALEATLPTDICLWSETRNLLEVGSLILKSAAFRTESRGGHYRVDYPHTDPAWQVHTLVQRRSGSLESRWWQGLITHKL